MISVWFRFLFSGSMIDLNCFDMYIILILKILNGNTDPYSPITSMFTTPLSARFIRINPTDWHLVPALRFEVLGCDGK